MCKRSNNSKYVSIATIWEIAIKISLNKFKFSKEFANFLSLIEDNGFELLPVTFKHALILSSLVFIHRDPLDRLIIAQCSAKNFILLTKDENMNKYDIKTLWQVLNTKLRLFQFYPEAISMFTRLFLRTPNF